MNEEDKLRAFVEAAPAALAMFDRDMRCLGASRRWREDYGVADTPPRARNYAFSPEEVENWRATYRAALAGESHGVHEECFVGSDGAWHWLRWEMQPWRDAFGKVGGVVASLQDITAHKRVEESLRQSRMDFARAQEVAQTGWWRLDTRRNVLSWSAESYRIFGVSPGTPMNYEAFLEIVHPDDRVYVNAQWRAALAGASYDIQHRLLVAGKTKWVREKAYLEYDETGGLCGGFGVTQDGTELVCALESLRESEERERLRAEELQTILDTAPIGLAIALDAEGRHIRGNRANEEYLGLPPGAELSFGAPRPPPYRVFDGERELDRAELPMQRAILEKARVTQTIEVVRPDGPRVTLFAKATPLYDEAGHARGAVGAFLDITPIKQAEDALKATRDTFRGLVRESPFGIFVVDADFRLAEVSAGADVTFRNSRQLIGAKFEDVLHAIWPMAAADEVVRRFRHTLETGAPHHTPDVVLRRRDTGELGSYDWRIERIKLPDGRLGVVCNFYDLTERLLHERELRASEERFRAIFEHAGTGIAITDMEGKFEHANPVYCDYLGYTPDELRALNFADLVHPEDAQANLDAFRQLEEIPFFEIENRYVRKDGDAIWVHKYVSLLRDANGNRFHLALVTDVTDRRRMEQALRESDRRKDEFLATLAHELRNPLAPIHNAVQVLKRVGRDDVHADRMLDMAERQIEHLVPLVDDLINVSRISRGKIELRTEPTDLARALAVAVETSEWNIRAKRQTLKTVMPESSIVLDADPVRIVQIFTNLLNNASKYTDEGGSVFLSLELDEGGALVRVRDTGAGIHPEMLPLVFDPFTQGAESQARGGGLGVGLALARGFVEMHGGTIEAHSAGLGKGAEFVVRLPLSERPNQTVAGRGTLEEARGEH